MNARERAARIRLLVLDVDGVLTDGGLYYGPDGAAMKRFNVQDGLGVKLAQSAGLVIAAISGLDSPAVAARMRELGIADYHAGHHAKISLVEGLCAKYGLSLDEAAFLGDDWVDAGPLGRVGLPMAVANAQPEILARAAWVSTRPGGHGAVREAIRFLLEAQGKLDGLWAEWSGR
jgi:3-deoxy-D-manno-octulosonate 8-phosphate phosphatase (KDO 8-P phosphatase)